MSDSSQNTTPDPTHVAIIMDGNGRWAKQRGLPRREGHRAGVENVRSVLRAARELDIRFLTLYTFSAENWNRPPDEVNLLMRLLRNFLDQQSKELIEHEIRFQVIGDTTALPAEVQKAIESVVSRTAAFQKYTLTLALNYGSRQELVRATRKLLSQWEGSPESLTYEMISAHLDTRNLPDPDLIIRTSGEYRLSNFLLLQSAYSEFYFSEKFWPEFDDAAFHDAINTYRKRERRFGKTGEQIQHNLITPLTGS